MIYKGSEQIQDIYIGGTKIEEIYHGSELVYGSGYPTGTVLFESGTPGTYTLVVDKRCTARLNMCGAGGNGSTIHMGGSGGYIYGNLEITAGTYTIVVGAAGGGNSSFKENVAGGGGNASNHGDGSGGTCVVVSSGLTGSNGTSGSTTGRINGYGAGGSFVGTGASGYCKIEVL